MVTPPVVADIRQRPAAGTVERNGGLPDDDVTVARTCFMIKAPL